MTVKQYFEDNGYTLNDLEAFVEEQGSAYWDGCFNFVSDNWERDLKTLSEKQHKWLEKIQDEVIERS